MNPHRQTIPRSGKSLYIYFRIMDLEVTQSSDLLLLPRYVNVWMYVHIVT